MSHRGLRLATALAAAGALACAAAARAHELGSGRVEVFLQRDGAFRVDLQLDPDVTLQRLQLAAGEPLTPGLDEAALRAALLARQQALVDTASLTASDTPLRTSFEYVAAPVPPAPSAPLTPSNARREATVRLAGRLPDPDAELQLAWTLPASRYAVVVHREGESGELETHWVEPGEASPPLRPASAAPDRLAVMRQYLGLGFTHILPGGLDHVLFVLGIFLFATRLKPVLWQVTAFTVAHSITLGLSIYGVVSLPSTIVEPLIALSIVYVAVENVLRPKLSPWRVTVVFAFGLLHGLGFAGVLSELGLPRSEFLTALVSFNVGVEAGQLAVIALAFVAVGSWARGESWYRQRVVVPASLAIAAVGLYWTLQRTML
jgi:hydrogenase/urease accessory protein HupE